MFSLTWLFFFSCLVKRNYKVVQAFADLIKPEFGIGQVFFDEVDDFVVGEVIRYSRGKYFSMGQKILCLRVNNDLKEAIGTQHSCDFAIVRFKSKVALIQFPVEGLDIGQGAIDGWGIGKFDQVLGLYLVDKIIFKMRLQHVKYLVENSEIGRSVQAVAFKFDRIAARCVVNVDLIGRIDGQPVKKISEILFCVKTQSGCVGMITEDCEGNTAFLTDDFE
jgi:hypothetical protein